MPRIPVKYEDGLWFWKASPMGDCGTRIDKAKEEWRPSEYNLITLNK